VAEVAGLVAAGGVCLNHYLFTQTLLLVSPPSLHPPPPPVSNLHPPPSLKPPRTLPGRARDLRLLIVLDTTRNTIALQEAAQRGVATVALASGQVDMSAVTYPVLARDFSPEFAHFFLDMLVRVANVKGGEDVVAAAAGQAQK
jgi:hypothetical protein